MCSDALKVAVLLAAHNGMSWLEEQLHSIVMQTSVCVRVFISVDASTDDTAEWCAAYVQQHAQATLLPPAGPFGGAAHNFFRLIRDVDFSDFDYVAFSDQDDIWYPDKLKRALSTLRTQGCDGYSSNVVAFWPDGRRLLLDKAQAQARWDYLFEAAGPGCTYVMSHRLAVALKTSLTDQWEPIQRISLHDWYCYAFARSQNFKWFIDPVPGLDYRQHGHNQLGANTGIASHTSRLARIVDNWWPEQVLLINQITGGSALFAKRAVHSKRLLFFALILNAAQCRRRRRDKFLFVIACLAAVVRR